MSSPFTPERLTLDTTVRVARDRNGRAVATTEEMEAKGYTNARTQHLLVRPAGGQVERLTDWLIRYGHDPIPDYLLFIVDELVAKGEAFYRGERIERVLWPE